MDGSYVAIDVQPAKKLNRSPFGRFWYAGICYDYSDLAADLKQLKSRWLFYGKSISQATQTDVHAARLFTYGRATRGKAHLDVWKHQKGISRRSYGVSGFFQTSTKLCVVTEKYLFDRQKSPALGLLYVIDSANAQVLDVDRFCESIERSEPENGEGEVLFSEVLPACRIVGAGTYQWSKEKGIALLKLLLNPNYAPADFPKIESLAVNKPIVEE
jgi:hypothetical protein